MRPRRSTAISRTRTNCCWRLAADDLLALARAMRDAVALNGSEGRLAAASSAALTLLRDNETFAAAQGALPSASGSSEAERLFNGRLIAALKVLSDATGQPANKRENQCDVVLVAAALSGLALLARSGRLAALGFTPEEIAQAAGRAIFLISSRTSSGNSIGRKCVASGCSTTRVAG